MNNKWTAGKIAALILGICAAAVVLWIAFLASLYQLNQDMQRWQTGAADDRTTILPDEEKQPVFDETPSAKTEYYEFADAIREDLPYEISFENYEQSNLAEEDSGKTVSLQFEYPRVSGTVLNLEGINAAIVKEKDLVEAHLLSAADLLAKGDEYAYLVDSYVTLMTEDVLSVVFLEYGYYNEEYLESYVVCVNVDMQTGMILKNTSLLEITDAFSVEFRERCEKQNGEVSGIAYFTDQEITDYLTNEDYLIAFYTPLGMEVGFNYYDGWVTVTYKDYEKYGQKF